MLIRTLDTIIRIVFRLPLNRERIKEKGKREGEGERKPFLLSKKLKLYLIGNPEH